MGRVGLGVIGVAALGGTARARDQSFEKQAAARVGESVQIGVFGGHGADCVTSTPPEAIVVVQPPRLGTLSQRQGVPYRAANSLSGTCLGAQFDGTAVDYAARAPGADVVVLDVRFRNGVAHWTIAVTVRP